MNSFHDLKHSRQIYFLYFGLFLGIFGLILALFYRPYIYRNGINDFHFADTLGSVFCVPTSVFIYYGISKKFNFGRLILSSTATFIVYEIPSSIKSGIDTFDYIAILVGALFAYLMFKCLKKIFHINAG